MWTREHRRGASINLRPDCRVHVDAGAPNTYGTQSETKMSRPVARGHPPRSLHGYFRGRALCGSGITLEAAQNGISASVAPSGRGITEDRIEEDAPSNASMWARAPADTAAILDLLSSRPFGAWEHQPIESIMAKCRSRVYVTREHPKEHPEIVLGVRRVCMDAVTTMANAHAVSRLYGRGSTLILTETLRILTVASAWAGTPYKDDLKSHLTSRVCMLGAGTPCPSKILWRASPSRLYGRGNTRWRQLYRREDNPRISRPCGAGAPYTGACREEICVSRPYDAGTPP